MNLARLLTCSIALLCAATSCATKVGTIAFDAPGESATVVMLDATHDVKFGTDLDLSYDDLSGAQYTIDLLQDGFLVGRTTCDPRLVDRCSVRIRLPGTWIESCRMKCGLRVPKSGQTVVQATFAVVGEDVKIERANLVVEQ